MGQIGLTMSAYYQKEDLSHFASIGKEAPELWDKFLSYYQATLQEGALTAREKSLIGLAVAHALQCPYCIDSFSNSCLSHGADPEQMTEAVHVVASVRAGATLVHGVQMHNHLDQKTL